MADVNAAKRALSPPIPRRKRKGENTDDKVEKRLRALDPVNRSRTASPNADNQTQNQDNTRSLPNNSSDIISHVIQITFEWELMGLKEIFESSNDDEKSPLIASSPFGGGKWQLHFYASAARAASCRLFLAAIPTAEEIRQGEQDQPNQEGEPNWTRHGPFSFSFEVKSLDKSVVIVARGPYEPMVRDEFTSACSVWGYPQYVRRAELYGEPAITKVDDGVRIICTLTYPHQGKEA
ncbi:hypothetical protein FS837_005071 [Tulasnella sp. UAMH 9824]|nr:hypothetical protein FS837_005071 [Tulasnella sp. UAMH 9824]